MERINGNVIAGLRQMESPQRCNVNEGYTTINFCEFVHGIVRRFGVGYSESHFGEYIQGIFFDNKTKSYVNGLITVLCNLFRVYAVFYPSMDKRVCCCSRNKTKALTAVKKTLQWINKSEFGGELRLYSNIPVGYGCGSSSADVVATIKAVANAFDCNLSPDEIALLAVDIETASDSIMYDNKMVLFAQRKGIVLRDFGSMPSIDVFGFSTSEQGVDTLSLQPIQYTHSEILEFESMVGLVSMAALTQDPKYLGIAAYKSALINQKYRPKPKRFANVSFNMVEDGLALGCSVSHSGTVIGFIFDAKEDYYKKNEKVVKIKKVLKQLGIKDKDMWRFSVNSN